MIFVSSASLSDWDCRRAGSPLAGILLQTLWSSWETPRLEMWEYSVQWRDPSSASTEISGKCIDSREEILCQFCKENSRDKTRLKTICEHGSSSISFLHPRLSISECCTLTSSGREYCLLIFRLSVSTSAAAGTAMLAASGISTSATTSLSLSFTLFWVSTRGSDPRLVLFRDFLFFRFGLSMMSSMICLFWAWSSRKDRTFSVYPIPSSFCVFSNAGACPAASRDINCALLSYRGEIQYASHLIH